MRIYAYICTKFVAPGKRYNGKNVKLTDQKRVKKDRYNNFNF